MAGSNVRPAGAFDPVDHVIRRLRAQRERWVDLGRGRHVQVLVLRETEMPSLSRRPLVEIVCEQAVGWRGFSEAVIFGAHDGAADEIPFSPVLWAEVARDDIDVVNAVGKVLIEHAEQVMEAREAAKKA